MSLLRVMILQYYCLKTFFTPLYNTMMSWTACILVDLIRILVASKMQNPKEQARVNRPILTQVMIKNRLNSTLIGSILVKLYRNVYMLQEIIVIMDFT